MFTTPHTGETGQVPPEGELAYGAGGNDAERKEFATMAAKAAQAGCTLHELSGGGFLLCRWGMAKELPCLRAVGDLVRRIGGAQ